MSFPLSYPSLLQLHIHRLAPIPYRRPTKQKYVARRREKSTKEGEGKIRADSKREGQGGEVGGSFVVVISVSVFTNASAFKLFQFPSISFPKWSKLLRTTRSLRTPVSFAGFSHPTMVAFPENARGKFFATLLDDLSPGTLFSLFPSSTLRPLVSRIPFSLFLWQMSHSLARTRLGVNGA